LYKLWSDWDLNQWLSYLENRNTQEIQLGLTRITAIAQKLSLLTTPAKVITVTGTNGKGSTVSALESIYHTAGYVVGSYTSPHLLTFNERIRVNCKPVSDSAICAAFAAIEDAREETVLTYFETATLAALWHFKQLNLDLIIMEVGIGGRLDATNIIDSDLAIVTTVDFDHQDYLGNTLEAIGYEKAGIMRQGKPIVYADSNPPLSILTQAAKLSAPSYLYGRDYSINENLDGWQLHYADKSYSLPIPKIQLKSAAAALMASFLLNDYLPINAELLPKAIGSIFLAGRLQLFPGPVDLLFDVSHNPQSATLLGKTLKSMKRKTAIHAVFSALKDKDIVGLINPLRDCVDHWYPAELHTKRAASKTILLTKFREADLFAEICYNTPLTAFDAALKKAKTGDLIVVFGSFFTVSQVMAAQNMLLN